MQDDSEARTRVALAAPRAAGRPQREGGAFPGVARRAGPARPGAGDDGRLARRAAHAPGAAPAFAAASSFLLDALKTALFMSLEKATLPAVWT